MIKKFNYHLSRFLIWYYRKLSADDGVITGKRYRQHIEFVENYEEDNQK